MKSKLYFGILIILMTFLGRYMETSVAPNQQIIIRFSDSQITESDTQNAIEAIKLKLQSADVKRIQIGEDEEGVLKITYYSNNDVDQIKEILFEEQDLQFAYSSPKSSKKLPKQKNSKDYELNISEIQKSGNSGDWDFDGVEIVEHNQKSDRFNNLKKQTSGHQNHSKLLDKQVEATISLNNNDRPLEDNSSYKTPEVRAGPLV